MGGRRGVDGSEASLLVSSVSTVRVGVPTLTGVSGRLDVVLPVLTSLGFEWIFLRQPILLSGMVSQKPSGKVRAWRSTWAGRVGVR